MSNNSCMEKGEPCEKEREIRKAMESKRKKIVCPCCIDPTMKSAPAMPQDIFLQHSYFLMM